MMAFGSPGSSDDERVTRNVPRSGPCCMGKYVAILPSVSRPYCLTTPATPTMVIGFFGSNQRCFPTASPCPESLREFLVDDGDLRSVEVVLIGEEAPRDQRNLHCLKVVCASSAYIDL